MSESWLSFFSLLCYLEELEEEAFSKFKELLEQEVLKRQLEPLSVAKLVGTSKMNLMRVLVKKYTEKQAWEMTLDVFEQLGQRHLWEKAKKEMRCKINPYRKHMEAKFRLLWEEETCLPVPESFYKETVKVQYEDLKSAFTSDGTSSRPLTVVLRGPEGIGKSTLLRRVMLDWTEGNLWRDRFTFVFFLDVHEMNHMIETSLVKFLSRDWPESWEPIEDVFSQPQEILLIIDGLEELKLNLMLENKTCHDWRQEQPVEIILRSLLRKNLLPDASLLTALGPSGFGKSSLLQYPRYITLHGLSTHERKQYFSHFFLENQAVEASSVLRDKKILYLCQTPLLCWLICSCVKWQMHRREEPEIVGHNLTSLFVSFFVSVVRGGYENTPPKRSTFQIKALCSLAAEGLWSQNFLFCQEDLERHGLIGYDVSLWLDLRLLRRHCDHISFAHQLVQGFCAALFCYTREPKDKPTCVVYNLIDLAVSGIWHMHDYFPQLRLFMFGIPSLRTRTVLGTSVGLKLGQQTWQELVLCLRGFIEKEDQKPNYLDLFSSLYETKEQKSVTQVMDRFRDMVVHIDSIRSWVVALYCLTHCRNLQELSIYVDNVFSEDSGPVSMKRKRTLWKKLCLVLKASKKLRVLKLDNCDLSDASLAILGRAVAHPICQLETLTLESCNITHENCADLASVLLCNQKLTYLSLKQNPLGDEGFEILSDALKHPNCVLMVLMFEFCCLSPISCHYLCEVLLHGPPLIVLNLDSNVLGEHGVCTLCVSLKNPLCHVQELRISGCLLTPSCCEEIASVLPINHSLKSLKLGYNEILDAGVKHLCVGLTHPNCNLEMLTIEMCGLTNACVKDLVSVLTTSKTLRMMNLSWITLDYDGVSELCKALTDPNCVMDLFGIHIDEMDEKSKMLLLSVEKRNHSVAITDELSLFDGYYKNDTMN
ncbi:PREDICTED: NACHT, LRR and PYD domains-containing protein 9-like [Elephantulus edwardii]|uniref:NACHT, LRR and PYD domains-containing protein 9-like n=1 Tax=Elephantulus edwardii TaxID=28737 RepID=UPI0003F08598|nr:PREDICTED: NACHT, LRR and PYD domains-containing protein 9-like [Elephantulus edwardii]